MRTISLAISGLLVVALACCGSRDEQSRERAEQRAKVPAPQVDLHAAVYTDDLEAIRRHIEAGSDLDMLEPSRSSSPLITAAALGRVEAARLLIDAGADLNYQNADGSTALHTATVFGKKDVAELLIDAGADLDRQNNEGSTALHMAAFFCRTEIVETLLKKGADKSIENKMGQTPLEIVELPFESIKGVYDAVGQHLKPLGVTLDYDRIRETRPKIADMLR